MFKSIVIIEGATTKVQQDGKCKLAIRQNWPTKVKQVKSRLEMKPQVKCNKIISAKLTRRRKTNWLKQRTRIEPKQDLSRPKLKVKWLKDGSKKSINVIKTGSNLGIALQLILCLLLCSIVSIKLEVLATQNTLNVQTTPTINEFQLIASSGFNQVARLPCLIGRQSICGEPYFIAWYKLNASSRVWSRIEAKSRDGGDEADSENEEETRLGWPANKPPSTTSRGHFASRPLVERAKLSGWPRDRDAPTSNCLLSSGEGRASEQNDNLLLAKPTSGSNQRPNQRAANLEALGRLFDCAQLTIGALELADEGQYKCEVTFSDSLDPDRCPASTLTQLTVIARPSEPQILVNGRAQVAGDSRPLKFKEGAQVRLECQSSGGRPAPRIEWLNLTTLADSEGAQYDLQLMRSQWPIKRTTQLTDSTGQLSELGQQQIPVTSSSLTITLGRSDLRSRFVCLVLAPSRSGLLSALNSAAQAQSNQAAELPAGLIARPADLANQLDRLAMLSAARLINAPVGHTIKWIKLDILVRPTSVSMQVLDLATNSLVRPSQLAGQPSSDIQQQQQHQLQPFYSLKPNQMYAIQCLIENSRPKSRVAWFNRTSPIELDTIELETADFELPSNFNVTTTAPHRLSSFTRFIVQQASDVPTFRTVATLLLTTSYYDNFEELFCRISNEAFQFDELVQVAPILSVRIYVNYPLSVWLESDSAWDFEGPKKVGVESAAANAKWTGNNTKASRSISLELNERLTLRCQVGANPLNQNSILQIEWLKDGRRLQVPQVNVQSVNKQQATNRVSIERANHLHMPQLASKAAEHSKAPSGSLALDRSRNSWAAEPTLAFQVGASRLLSSSLLSIGPLTKQDAGLYSCQFKLIPAPTAGESGPGAVAASGHLVESAPLRIVSGQANQSIELLVIEEKLPIVWLASSSPLGLTVYLSKPTKQKAEAKKLVASPENDSRVLVVDPTSSIRLKCDFADRRSGATHFEQELRSNRRAIWFLDGAFLCSSLADHAISLTPNDETMNRLLEGDGGQLSCALQLANSSSSAASLKSLRSANQINLRFQKWPSLVGGAELLMPKLRSFNELELSSQPTNRLRLACSARCEPNFCSIDWLINERPLITLDRISGNATDELLTAPDLLGSRQVFRAGLAGTSLNLVKISQQFQVRNSTWLQKSSLLPPVEFSRLTQLELAESNSTSNVFSRLELNYNQLSQLLSSPLARPHNELLIECRLNKLLENQLFEHFQVHQNVWFPLDERVVRLTSRLKSAAQLASNSSGAQTDEDYSYLEADELATTRANLVATGQDSKLSLASQTNMNLSLLFGQQPEQDRVLDRLQTRVLLESQMDKVFITLRGADQTKAINELTLNEQQLRQLLDDDNNQDTNKMQPADPVLSCATSRSEFSSQVFKWSFSSETLNEILVETKQDLNLRQLLQFRRRQLEMRSNYSNRNLSLDAELMGQIFGNYTCSLASSGTDSSAASSSLSLSFLGRPICKLSLANGSQILAPETQLDPAIRFNCLIYSTPGLLEAIWMRNNELVASNKSLISSSDIATETNASPFEPIVNWLKRRPNSQKDSSFGEQANIYDKSQPVLSLPSAMRRLSSVELSLQMFDEQSGDFLMSDFLLAGATGASLGGSTWAPLECVARNSLGRSESCRLSDIDRQTLIVGLANLTVNKSSISASHNFVPASASPTSLNRHEPIGNNKQHINFQSETTANSPPVWPNWLTSNLDWLLVLVCALALLWIVALILGPALRRRLQLSPGYPVGGYKPDKERPKLRNRFLFNRENVAKLDEARNWRFQTSLCSSLPSSSNTNSNSNSNTNSELGSGGLFVASHQLAPTARTATNRHTMSNAKRPTNQLVNLTAGPSSFYGGFGALNGSDSSEQEIIQSCNSQSSQYEEFGQQHQLLRLSGQAQKLAGANWPRTGDQSSTFRRRPANPIHSQIYSSQRHQVDALQSNANQLSDYDSRPPLIDGSKTSSRIRLNQQNFANGHCERFEMARNQRTRPVQEPIYDDVIYNRMIL